MTPLLRALLNLYLLAMIPVIAGVVIWRWKRGYHLWDMLPDGVVLAYLAPFAGKLALERTSGTEFSALDWSGLVAAALSALVLVLDRTSAHRMALRLWIGDGLPWADALAVAREINAKAKAAIRKKKS